MKGKALKCSRALALAILLLAGMTVGTAAYLVRTQSVVNEFRTGKYSTDLVEKFEPPDDWEPGEQTSKEVKVSNDGTIPVFAGIKVSRQWTRREDAYSVRDSRTAPGTGALLPDTFPGADGREYAAQIQWGRDVVQLSERPGSGSPALGLPEVASPEEAQGKWLLTGQAPDEGGSLTFYYMGVLAPGEETPLLMEGVRMNPDIRAATLSESTVWDRTARKWVTTTKENPAPDYGNARFTLGVTMNTVQATEAAMEEMFGSDRTSSQAAAAYLESMAVRGTDTDYSRGAEKEKKLYLRKEDGALTYTPSAPGGNWFMSHLNIMPGESYEDTLLIENHTEKSWSLSMQAVPRDGQGRLPKELLERIRMKVYCGERLIYDGTASGAAPGQKGQSGRGMRDSVSLGEYAPGQTQKLRAELTLDSDTPPEYADILTRIDWKFISEEKPVSTGKSAKTGDANALELYLVFMALSSAAAVLLLIYDRQKRKGQKFFLD